MIRPAAVALLALPLAIAGLAAAAMGAEHAAPAPPRDHPVWWTTARSDYIEHCGGCHGLAGTSAPAKVPVLRDRVGYFMCTPEGRDYLVRLPNVAHAPLTDQQEMADLLNYVVFGLGGDSAPQGATPFAAEEVGKLRQNPLSDASLVQKRARLVAAMIRTCKGVPASLRYFYPGAPAATVH